MSDELTLWERPVSRRGFIGGTAALVAAAGMGRLGADAFAAVRAAEAEGTLLYYNWAQYVHPKLKGGARGYDLIVPTGYMTKIMIAEKLLQPLDWKQLPTVKKNIDPSFLGRSDDPRDRYSVVKDWGTTGFMYRTD